MKFNSILSEDQIDELGIFKNIRGAVQGARAGYQAKKMQKKGTAHAGRIVNNLRTEFNQLVGGGLEPTYQNLMDFLADQGLEDLESIPKPASSSTARIDPTLEAVGDKLAALDIDKIIQTAVNKNYAKIVAAQQGKSFGGNKPTEAPPEPTKSAEPAAKPTVAPTAPTLKSPPVAGNLGAITKAYSMLDPNERAELKKQLEIIDDQDRLASGTNESKLTKLHSNYLGIDL
jgi:hypothetical protein